MTPLQTLQYYFTFPFVRYALIVGVLIALCASLFGVTLVLKRFSFIGDGLSHVAFGALAVAAVFNLTDEMLLVLPVTVIAAVLLLRSGQSAKTWRIFARAVSKRSANGSPAIRPGRQTLAPHASIPAPAQRQWGSAHR